MSHHSQDFLKGKKFSIDITNINVPCFGLVCSSVLLSVRQSHLPFIAFLWYLFVRITKRFANTKLLLSNFFSNMTITS